MAQVSYFGILPSGACIKPIEDGMDKAGMLEFTYYELSELFWRVKEIKVDSVNLSSSNLWSYNSDPTDNLPLADSETQLVCGPRIDYTYNNYYIYNEDSNGGVALETIFPFGYYSSYGYIFIKNVYFDKTNNLYYVLPYFNAVMDNDVGRYYYIKTPEGGLVKINGFIKKEKQQINK
jgi:hypothetical protein